jgi:alpha-mannosidase
VAEVVTPDQVPAALQPVVRDLLGWLARAGVTATCSRSAGTRYGSVDVDSNLPDFRVSLGGPSENAFTAEVLAACDPAMAKRLAQLVSDAGAARLWVPAAKGRDAAFAPGADLRGPRDLPVLIVATAEPGALAQAISELERDLMFEVIPADACGSDVLAPGDAPLGDGAIALFNQGTPGGVVAPDGTLWMSLFRACSGWPSGVWIDADRRTAPDGSSFAWQHWSHTFCYALAATGAAGGWRAAGFNAAAEEYNHDLLALVSPADDAVPAVLEGPAPGGLLSVEGAPNVTLSTVKPAGNPLAAGLPGAPSRTPGEVTVRLRETDGRTAVARLRFAAVVEAAWVSDLLEERYGAALPSAAGQAAGPLSVTDGAVLVPVRPFETVTLRVRLAEGGSAAEAAAGPGVVTAGPPEPAQPVFTRYWLHGKGPAPAGNVPVAVHFSPNRVTLSGEAPSSGSSPAGDRAGSGLTLTVACGPAGDSGEVDLVVPAGLTAAVTDPDSGAPAGGPLRYDLGPNEFASWDVTVSALPGAADGRYFLTARITDGLGQVLEDAALVTIGEAGGPDPDLEPEELFARLQADVTALAGEAGLELAAPAVRLAPGESGELAVRVTSRLNSELRGEVQLVSPVGTWQAVAPWTQPVTVAPGGEATVKFAVTVPATAAPGWESWLLVKLMYFGRVRYSPAVPLTVG